MAKKPCRTRRGRLRASCFRRSASPAGPMRRTGSGAEASAKPAGPECPSPRPGAAATCDEAIPAAPLGAACGRCLLEPPAFEQLRAAAPYRGLGAGDPAGLQVSGSRLPRTRLAAVMAERCASRRRRRSRCACPSTPGPGAKGATTRPRCSPRRSRGASASPARRGASGRSARPSGRAASRLARRAANVPARFRRPRRRRPDRCSSWTTWRRPVRPHASAPPALAAGAPPSPSGVSRGPPATDLVREAA